MERGNNKIARVNWLAPRTAAETVPCGSSLEILPDHSLHLLIKLIPAKLVRGSSSWEFARHGLIANTVFDTWFISLNWDILHQSKNWGVEATEPTAHGIAGFNLFRDLYLWRNGTKAIPGLASF